MDPITIGTAIGTSLITSFATKGDSEPIKTLNDIWYLAFGRMQLFADKKRAKNKTFLDVYQNELVQEISAIPEENLIEPPLSIVGPALNSAQYYIEEEVLRKMFSKIISSSMDNRKSSRAHHAFVEIIKQLSPLDASNLKVFQHRNKLPIVNYGINIGFNGNVIFHPHVFIHNQDCNDSDAIASSLINLQRLGLINIEYSKGFLDEELYKDFDSHELLDKISKMIDSDEFSENAELLRDVINLEHVSTRIEKGTVEVTPLGKDFIFTCL
ncbi:DUF4393 domain-containing protein [Sporosarcina sp. E16_8]|uniref:DUF4393 domain-containing protein n=1 Tax=Sporosarcina sp. E16_8 TaxID=2789295 RepID=UPI001A930569|nr:DUF4393 domain-containing protein [Sporosarcina sp. E16_8]MBO0586480.1 DUF4393 domain-containing protein [Sporosarcina sp. E16_8]